MFHLVFHLSWFLKVSDHTCVSVSSVHSINAWLAVHFDSDNTIMRSTISPKSLTLDRSPRRSRLQRTSWWLSESGGNQDTVGEDRLTQILDLCSLSAPRFYNLLKMLVTLPASQAYYGKVCS